MPLIAPKELLAVQAEHNREDCARALRAAIALYESLRSAATLTESFEPREAAAKVTVEYLNELA